MRTNRFIGIIVAIVLATSVGCTSWQKKLGFGGDDNNVDQQTVSAATGLSDEAQALVKTGIPDFMTSYMPPTTTPGGETKKSDEKLDDSIEGLSTDTKTLAEKSAAREAWVRRVKALRDSIVANGGTVAELLSKSGFRDLDEVLGYGDFRPGYLGKKIGSQIIGEKQVRLIWNGTERDTFRTNHPTTSDEEIKALDAPFSPPAEEPKADPKPEPAADDGK